MGNHDYAVAFNTDCRCAPELHELSEYTRRNISLKLLGDDQVKWLRTLPKSYTSTHGGSRVYVVHGSPRNPLYGYLKPTLPLDELKLSLTASMVAIRPKLVDADVVLVGHTHIPVDFRVEHVRVLNPGSVGQPRDGDPRASYMVIDLGSLSVELRRVKYDVDRVVSKLNSLGIEAKYVTWLRSILTEGRV